MARKDGFSTFSLGVERKSRGEIFSSATRSAPPHLQFDLFTYRRSVPDPSINRLYDAKSKEIIDYFQINWKMYNLVLFQGTAVGPSTVPTRQYKKRKGGAKLKEAKNFADQINVSFLSHEKLSLFPRH